MRIGIGYDVHGFHFSRPLVIGGVTVPDAPGLAGHSDADVACHAIIDALLGAAALGDLGEHFPEGTVPEGTASVELLVRTREMLAEAGFRVANVDVTVVIEDVRVAPHRDEIRTSIAAALAVDPGRVSVKATTTDGLGFVGRGEGALGVAVALIEETGE